MTRVEPRTLAPFGRRTLTVAERRALGAYVVLAAADPDGPRRAPGQFYMLAAAERWGGGDDERPVPAARVLASLRAARRRGLRVHARGRRARAPSACASSSPATACASPARSGIGFAPPARRPPRAAVRRRRRAPRRWRSGRTSCWRRGEPAPGAARLPRRRARRRAPTLLHNAARRHRRRLARPPRPRHRPARRRARRRRRTPSVYACGPPPMLEAVRALCAERGVPAPARARVGHGLRLRRLLRLRRAAARRRLPAPVRRRARSLDGALLDGGARRIEPA